MPVLIRVIGDEETFRDHGWVGCVLTMDESNVLVRVGKPELVCFGKWGTCEIVEISFKDHAVRVAMGRE